jgi:hypothetical protein
VNAHRAGSLDAAAAFIQQVRWQFAKTMPDWPHEYTIKSWRPELMADFEAFCQLIETPGVTEAWPPAPAHPIYHNRYLVIGSYKYWAMGPTGDSDPIDSNTVINRELQGKPGF